jgi:hypothetical protein
VRQSPTSRDLNTEAVTGEDIADREGLVHAAVNYRVCELAIAQKLLAVTICKRSINPITNPNPV